MKGSTALFALALWMAVTQGVQADDWPADRHDLARSGVTEEQLPTPLHRQWTHAAAHRPMPAWPEPGRELNRTAFDYVYGVTAAGGLVYYGSSADHKVYALDLATGEERWSFFTEGPVRFAPTVEGGRVFVASDDGWLYCLSAGAGKLLWRFRAAPGPEKLLGNERMISRWPLRSGVGVEDGVVYVTAGMWPAEGVCVYALRAETGEVLWDNATSGSLYVKQPHPGSFSMTGVTPQGLLLAQGGQLFVPTGRNVPAAYDRETGKLLYYRSAPTNWGNRWGGSWNFLAGGLLFGWRCHIGPDIDVLLGEYPPDKNDGIVCFEAKTGKEIREFAGKLDAVVNGDALYASGGGKVTAYDLKAWLKGAKAADCTRWEADHARAYALIMAGNTLFVGGKDTVTAIDAAKGKVLWHDKVKGQARSLAVAGGSLLVSTTEGRIACYGAKPVDKPAVVSPKKAPSRFEGDKPDSEAATLARRILEETGKTEGLCLALGAGDGRLLYHLAKQSKLTIYCVEPSARRAAEVRDALDAAGLHGVRVTVHRGSLRDLPYPDFFADLIVLGDGSSRTLRQCSVAELYRVLRPCGGIAWLPPAGRAGVSLRGVGRFVERAATLGTSGPLSADAIFGRLRDGGVPDGEIQVSATTVQVVRGKLPGSDNWTHQYASAGRTGGSNDQRVRLPLKLLWFGKPGPARLVTRHWGGPAPLCVDGRMFVPGQFSLIAVDAYNGRELWSRDFPRVAWWPVAAKSASVAADSDGVYLVQDTACLRLDPATGKTMQTYLLPKPPDGITEADAKKLRWSCLAVGHGRILGSMGSDKAGKAVFVLGKDGKTRWVRLAAGTVDNNSLSMDAGRVYAIERTDPAAVARAKRRGEAIPAAWRLVALDAATGKVAWQTDKDVAGRTELWLSEGVLVASSPSALSGYDAASGKQLYVREAPHRRFPVITGGTIYAEPHAYDLRTGEPRERANPFTGKSTQWSFLRSYGCGAMAGAPNVLMFRSGTLGIYDLAGDGGVFNFGGVRAGCYVNAIAANGLLLCPPADAACTCSYSLRTTVALAPAKRARDWSIFYDKLPTTAVKQCSLNLGALGDRRDQDGALWLALPRPDTRTRRKDIAVPFRVTMHEGFGPYRRSADRVEIEGTERPWLYASGLKGLKHAALDLAILDRGIAAWPARGTPKIDGLVIDPAWQHGRAYRVGPENASVTAVCDDFGLYLAYERPAARPWKAAERGDDAAVWKDDSFEIYLSPVPAAGAASRRCVHLGVSASGARYDGEWVYVSPFPACDIPKLEVKVDGKPDEWADRGLRVLSLTAPKGKMRAPADFDPSLRIGWSEEGVLLLVQVKDNAVCEAGSASRLWEGDSIELFVTPRLGWKADCQVVISPGVDPKQPKPRIAFYGPHGPIRGKAVTARVAGAKTADGYVVEVLLPWRNVKIKPAEARMFGMQIFVNDNDKPGGVKQPFRVQWHPGGHPFTNRDPHAYQRFRLASAPGKPIEFKRGAKPGKDGLYTAVPPYPFPLTAPPLGAKGEDPEYAGPWSGAVRVDKKAFIAEVAVPWETLKKAGLSKDNLMLNFASRGPLTRAPKLGQGYERLLLVPAEMAKPATFTVRLHFAELEDVERGQRVFDVKLQGKTVLEDFDVVRAARGRNRAIVKQFDGITASRALTLELISKAAELTPSTAPILNAIEVLPASGAK